MPLFRSLCLAIGMSALLAISHAACAQEPSPQPDVREEVDSIAPEFQYEIDPDHLVFEFAQHTMVINALPLGLKLYGDGRVVATLPAYLSLDGIRRFGYNIARRGLFETQMSQQEMNEILVAASPAILLNTQEMKEQRKAQHPGRGSTDGGATHLSINLIAYRPAESYEWVESIDREIKWNDVYGDAKLYPGVPGIQALWEADKALSAHVYAIAERVSLKERGQ